MNTTSRTMNQATSHPSDASSAGSIMWVRPWTTWAWWAKKPAWIPAWLWSMLRALWGAGWTCMASLLRWAAAVLWMWPTAWHNAWNWWTGARPGDYASSEGRRWQWLRWGRRLRVSPEQQ